MDLLRELHGYREAENTIDICRTGQFYIEALNWTLAGS